MYKGTLHGTEAAAAARVRVAGLDVMAALANA